jgi:tellurite resistance protein TerC
MPLNLGHDAMSGTFYGWESYARATMNDYLATQKPEHYQLFRKEDMTAWIVFTIVFFVLVFVDNFILHRKAERLNFAQAMIYTLGWIMCAAAFDAYIFWERGLHDAVSWATGYSLEWMLSVDNLFVFHLIFQKFGTPDEQKHKPLFYGIVGAIIFRMIFFCVGEVLLHRIWWMHILFGAFLIYTGVMAVISDDEEEDPQANPVFKWLAGRIRFVNSYDKMGSFYIMAGVDPKTGEVVDTSEQLLRPVGGGGARASLVGSDPDEEDGTGPTSGGTMTAHNVSPQEKANLEYQSRATLLLLVVICLELTDVMFAVDSVSAIVAQIPDLYLAYTACVFAMLGLRAMFFVIDELVKLFSLLKYGVGLILCFIGVKLLLKGYVYFPPMLVSGILFATLATSMVASVVYEKYFATEEDKDED